MSDNLVINQYPLPFPLHHKAIRSSSFRGTNISSSLKHTSLIPDYQIPVPYSRIRSSKNSAIFYSKLFVKTQISPQGMDCRSCQVHFSQMPNALLGAAHRYPKGAEHSKSSKQPKGKPQLKGFSDSTIAFGPHVPFDPDSFRLCDAENQAKIRPPKTLCTFKGEGAERSLRSINLRFFDAKILRSVFLQGSPVALSCPAQNQQLGVQSTRYQGTSHYVPFRSRLAYGLDESNPMERRHPHAQI